MNGEILRGEVYWICLDDSIGSEERTGRPGVVVSADGLNVKDNRVTIAFMTREGFPSATSPSISDPKNGRTRVLCDQLRTVDKSRLSKYMFTLDSSELSRVTGALAAVFCLRIPKSEPKNVISDLETNDTLRCEADMWRRMYEKVMDQLVEMRVAADMARKSEPEESVKSVKRTALVEPDTGCEEPEESPKSKVEEFVRKPVNANTASAKEISQALGVSMTIAYRITGYRKNNGNFVAVEELLEVPQITKPMFNRIKDYIVISEETESPVTEPPQENEKVNINTANMYELMKVGFSKEVSARIVYIRKTLGKYESVDDLSRVDGISGKNIRDLRDKLEV